MERRQAELLLLPQVQLKPLGWKIEAIYLDASELNSRLNGTDGTRLMPYDVKFIVKTLAEWGAIRTRAEAVELLHLMNCSDFEAIDWEVEPLKSLALPPPSAGLVLD